MPRAPLVYSGIPGVGQSLQPIMPKASTKKRHYEFSLSHLRTLSSLHKDPYGYDFLPGVIALKKPDGDYDLVAYTSLQIMDADSPYKPTREDGALVAVLPVSEETTIVVRMSGRFVESDPNVTEEMRDNARKMIQTLRRQAGMSGYIDVPSR